MNEQIINIIAETIHKTYKNDIAIFAVYGSYVRGDAHEKSDIDFYFIPKTNKGYELHTSFVLDGVGYDLWPLSWERLESFAEYKGMVSLIADAKVIYYGSDEDLSKFIALQDKAKHPTDVDFDGEARKILEICKQDFFDMTSTLDLSRQIETAVKIIENLVFAVTLINKTYTHSGWGKSIIEISNMRCIPDRFMELCSAVICSENNAVIRDNIQLLIKNTAALLTENQHTCNIQNDFVYFYEEAKSLYNKLYNACDINDSVTALMAGVSIQRDIISMLSLKEYQRIGFPDITATFHCGGLYDYKDTVRQHEQCLIEFLHKHNMKINIYNTVDDFRKSFIRNEENI